MGTITLVEDIRAETGAPTRHAAALRGSNPSPLVVGGVFFLLLVVLQFQWGNIPPYHDGLIHFYSAAAIMQSHHLPYVQAGDTGHPQLLPWLLSLLWRAGVPNLLAMHLLLWALAAVLLASVHAMTRRAFGPTAAVAASLLMLSHPVVFSQMLQFNLDLPMAAFAMLAVAGAAAGRPWLIALGGSLMCLCKLNGVVGMGPFMLFAFVGICRERRWRSPRLWCSAAWPIAVPFLALGAYTAGKYALYGRFADSGEFEGGRQIAWAATPGAVATNLRYSLERAFFGQNGNGFALALLGVLACIAGTRARFRAVLREWTTAPEPAVQRFWAPLSPLNLLLLLGLMLAIQITVQSARAIPTLTRYFIVVYPSLFVPLAGLLSAIGGRRQRALVAAVGVPLLLLFVLKWHPANAGFLPDGIESRLRFPVAGTMSCGEENLEFVTYYHLLEHAAVWLEATIPEPRVIDGAWPAPHCLADPNLGLAPVQFHLFPSLPDQGGRPIPAQAFLLFNTWGARVMEPDAIPIRGYTHARTFQSGDLWVAVYRPFREGAFVVVPEPLILPASAS